jgi:predicted enzyme related to lactoylglutathione lyase
MSTVAQAVGKFVWHEQVSPDPKKAQDFYTRLFGWGTETFKPGDVDYTMIAAAGGMHGGFGKAMEGAPPPHWLSHVRVVNVDETAAKAKSAGGTIAAGPFDMEDVGRMAIIADPQGAYIGIFQPESDAPDSQGVFVWDELGTTDVDGAQRFYEAVFPWKAQDMGADFGGYRIFNVGDNGVAGLMSLDPPIPPHWQPYVGVNDPDATVAKAKELGASVLVEPMDIPGVGRFAVLQDPQGAAFGVIRGDPSS